MSGKDSAGGGMLGMLGWRGGGPLVGGEVEVIGSHWGFAAVGEAVMKSVPAVVRVRKSANGGVLSQERMLLNKGEV